MVNVWCSFPVSVQHPPPPLPPLKKSQTIFFKKIIFLLNSSEDWCTPSVPFHITSHFNFFLVY